MNTDLTEEEMRRALFGSAASVPQVADPAAPTSIQDILLAQPAKPQPNKKTAKAFTQPASNHAGRE